MHFLLGTLHNHVFILLNDNFLNTNKNFKRPWFWRWQWWSCCWWWWRWWCSYHLMKQLCLEREGCKLIKRQCQSWWKSHSLHFQRSRCWEWPTWWWWHQKKIGCIIRSSLRRTYPLIIVRWHLLYPHHCKAYLISCISVFICSNSFKTVEEKFQRRTNQNILEYQKLQGKIKGPVLNSNWHVIWWSHMT